MECIQDSLRFTGELRRRRQERQQKFADEEWACIMLALQDGEERAGREPEPGGKCLRGEPQGSCGLGVKPGAIRPPSGGYAAHNPGAARGATRGAAMGGDCPWRRSLR